MVLMARFSTHLLLLLLAALPLSAQQPGPPAAAGGVTILTTTFAEPAEFRPGRARAWPGPARARGRVPALEILLIMIANVERAIIN